jgi:hypothetical protein
MPTVTSDDFIDALIQLDVSWPSTIFQADSILGRFGYERPGHGDIPNGTATTYVLRDSNTVIDLLVNVGRRFASSSYRPLRNSEMSEELIKELKEKCTSSSFAPPDEFQFQFVDDAMSDSVQWVTDIGIAMPKGTWRYTTTRLQRKKHRT